MNGGVTSSTMCHWMECLTATDPIRGESQRIQDRAGETQPLPYCSLSVIQQQDGFIPLTADPFCHIRLAHKGTKVFIDPFISLAVKK